MAIATTTMEREELKLQLKEQFIKYLNLEGMTPDELDDDELLFGEGLGLDSIDAIELIVLLDREYGIKLNNAKEGRKVLVSINKMVDYVIEHQK